MKSIRLLLIEDDRDSAEAIVDLLEMQGIHVEWAASAGEAIAKFEANPDHHVDLIMLDLMLPDMDGPTLISRLERIATLPPVVIHSAASQRLVQEAGKRIGAAAVLRKPADWGRMREVLEHAAAAPIVHGH